MARPSVRMASGWVIPGPVSGRVYSRGRHLHSASLHYRGCLWNRTRAIAVDFVDGSALCGRLQEPERRDGLRNGVSVPSRGSGVDYSRALGHRGYSRGATCLKDLHIIVVVLARGIALSLPQSSAEVHECLRRRLQLLAGPCVPRPFVG